MNLIRALLILLLVVASGTFAGPAGAGQSTPPLKPFTATYQVLRGGSALGTSTLKLRQNTDGTWTYTSRMHATSGLGALLSAKVNETSRFRQHDGRMEAIDYDYAMHVAVKDKSRHVRVDWSAGTVQVKTGKDGPFHYTTKPGLVERHLLVLALGQAVAAGQQKMTVPVAVKDRVQMQTFAAGAKADVSVPAGTFHAIRVDRTHDDKGWSAWYASKRYGPIPVKVMQSAGGNITLLLESVKKSPNKSG